MAIIFCFSQHAHLCHLPCLCSCLVQVMCKAGVDPQHGVQCFCLCLCQVTLNSTSTCDTCIHYASQVKLKNPSLLLQLQCVAPRMPGLSSSLLNISDGLSSPNKTLLTSIKHSPSSISSPSKTLLTSLKRSPSSLTSPTKILSMSLLRSPSEIRGTLQQSDRGLSQKGLPWAY